VTLIDALDDALAESAHLRRELTIRAHEQEFVVAMTQALAVLIRSGAADKTLLAHAAALDGACADLPRLPRRRL
jgi:hypothetical protein